MKSVFSQADGSLLELEVRGYELTDPWDSSIRITMPIDGRSPDAKSIRQLNIAHSGNSDDMITNVLRGAVYHRLAAQGGEFLVSASGEPETQGVALWRGPYHEISTYVPSSSHRDAAVALRPLMGLAFEDSPVGLIVRPESVLNATVSVIVSSSYVKGVGTVDLRSATEALGAVPTWAGAKVPAGEVWRVQEQNMGDSQTVEYLELATDSAVMFVTPDSVARKTRNPLAPALDFAQAVVGASVTSKQGALR